MLNRKRIALKGYHNLQACRQTPKWQVSKQTTCILCKVLYYLHLEKAIHTLNLVKIIHMGDIDRIGIHIRIVSLYERLDLLNKYY